METTDISIGNISSKNPSHLFNDFELDNFKFTPLTKGLGFHKENSYRPTNRRSANLGTFKENDFKQNKIPQFDNSIESGLEKFYSSTNSSKNEIKESVKTIFQQERVNIFSQLSAWLIDLSIIATLAFALVTMTKLMFLIDSLGLLDSAGLFIIVHLTYFTFLDLVGTPGKSIFDLSIKAAWKERLSISDTFSRSLILLISFIALGLPIFFGFHDKLSDTKIIKC